MHELDWIAQVPAARSRSEPLGASALEPFADAAPGSIGCLLVAEPTTH